MIQVIGFMYDDKQRGYHGDKDKSREDRSRKTTLCHHDSTTFLLSLIQFFLHFSHTPYNTLLPLSTSNFDCRITFSIRAFVDGAFM